MAAIIYCLVPEESAGELIAVLRAHYKGRPGVEVIVEQRRDERRVRVDAGPPAQSRRSGEQERRSRIQRRRPVVPRELAPELPDVLVPRAESLRWVQRLGTVRRGLEHVDLHGLLALVAQGHEQALSELYWRYSGRVATRASGLLVDRSQADEAIRRAFGRLFDALPSFGPEHGPFEALVDAAVDEVVVRGTIR